MIEPGKHAEAAVVVAFLQRYARDRERGRVLPLSDYQARYPGFEDVVSREHERLADTDIENHPGSSPVPLAAEADRDDSQVSLDEPDAEALAGLAAATERGGRYSDAVELGRGGVGTVMRVWDPDIRRKVAMKQLRGDDRGSSGGGTRPSLQVLSRFIEEAQITGQLGHPGIVPVHELGIDAAGRAYFTMSLVHGRDLKQIIELVPSGADGWSRTRVLGVIQRVCEAVAFAHSKGVVHRDLKPSNVMVGRFGETYVMDWGLARVLGHEDHRDIRLRPDATDSHSTVQSLRRDLAEDAPDSPLVTMDGDVIGTPAYMAPEQAAGHVGQVGTRADVYSIGAMLYHLLTGQPPYVPNDARLSSRSVLTRVVKGPPRRIHDLAAGAPSELVAICDKAMARAPEGRYPDVIALAEDLRAFLETRVVHAYEAGAVAELRKWVVRNRGLALASAAAVLALALGLLFSLNENGRANRQANRAEASFQLAFTAAEELADVGLAGLRDIPQMDETRKKLVAMSLEFHRQLLEQRGDDPAAREQVARSHYRVARLSLAIGDSKTALREATTAVELSRALGEEMPMRQDLRLLTAAARSDRAIVFFNRGDYRGAMTEYRAAGEVLADLATADPDSVELIHRWATTVNNVANCLHHLGEKEEALTRRREVIGLRRRAVDKEPDNPNYLDYLAVGHFNLGHELQYLARDREARDAFRAALVAVDNTLQKNPTSRTARYRLANTLARLAGLELALGEATTAEQHYERAVGVYRQLVEEFPKARDYHGHFGGLLTNFSTIPIRSDDFGRARELLEEAIEHKRIALRLDPDHATFRSFLEIAYVKLGDVLLAAGEHADAAACAEDLVRELPTAGHWWRAGGILARCMTAVDSDENLEPSGRAAALKAYTVRAIEMLRAALVAGFTDTAALDSSTLDALRSNADFQALVRDLHGSGKE